ncbi:MAG: PD-(D/E)XK nuclease family protein [Candidatus Desulfofervidaceae bacterium]|nr:PD-(D/E)XK nuclease family protein [Candidatus Desulfofervidaceae bacterium]
MISYSRIKTFKTCPKKYFYSYLEGRKAAPTKKILEGTTEHEKISKGNIPAFFKPAFERNFINPIFEEAFEEDFLTFTLKGVIDCYSINNSLSCAIADWKLYQIPESDEQLKIYALLLSKRYPDLEFFTAYFVSIKGGFYKRYTYSQDDIKDFEKELIETAEEIISAEDFPVTPGNHCSYCPYIEDCYKENKLPEKIKSITITDVEDAKKIAEKVLIAESFIKQVKEELKKFMFEYGMDELQIDDTNRLYLSPSITMRFGKVKKTKTKVKKGGKNA